jgi:murein DD-endopeptidase MepM/ murein hydrolase activator NlpD
MNAKYKARLRAMEETGKVSYWSILFKANSFSDLLSRIDSIHEVAEADNRMLDQMQSLSERIEKDREDLEAELKAQEAVKQELAEKELVLQEQRSQADLLLLELKDAYDNLSEEYLDYEAREEELRQEILEAQAAYNAALSAEEAARLAAANKNNAAGGSKPSSNSGGSGRPSSGFSSPLGSMVVTCAYGWRIHPIWGDRRFHSGVDLAANQGTPIYAIAAGTVTTATYGDAYGYNVSISHGGGYGSMYAHMTNYTVSAGQSVSQGEIIGYVGSTGWSTGPHLHFEVYLNGASVNPMDYVG